MVEVRSALLYDCAERVSIAIGGRRKRGREVTHYEWQASTSALFTHVFSLTLFFFSLFFIVIIVITATRFFLCMCNGAPTNERRQSVAFKVEGTRTYTTTISSRSNNIIKTTRKDKSNQDQKKKKC